MMKKVYLTKKRLKALEMAITLDDILYAKFDRLHRQLNEDVRRLYLNPKKVFRVIKKHKNHLENVQIIDVQMSDEGSVIYVT